MLGLPESTEFNKRIPKQKFYDNLTITPKLKKQFTNSIKTIIWRNKIAEATINLAKGKYVTELEIIEIQLNSPTLDENILRVIDKEIPYHILYLVEYRDLYQIWVGYKEVIIGDKSKVSRYYHTDWMTESDLLLKIEGLNLDVVYENFVKQVAGNTLETDKEDILLQDMMARDEQKEQLQRQITLLEEKMRKEPQLNRQVEINSELKNLKKKMEDIT